MLRVLAVAFVAWLTLSAPPLRADPVGDFYAGKQIQFIVGTTPGGDSDRYTAEEAVRSI